MTPARVSLYIKGMGKILILAQYTNKPTKKLQSSCGELVVVTFSERQNIVKDIELQREELYIERGLMRGLIDHEMLDLHESELAGKTHSYIKIFI